MASSSRLMLCSASRAIWNTSINRPPLHFSRECQQFRKQHSSSFDESNSDISSHNDPKVSLLQQPPPASSIEEVLSYLDSLNPEREVERRRGRTIRKEHESNANAKRWSNTVEAVRKSFSVAQLKKMYKHTNAPISLLQQIRSSRKELSKPKEVYAMALVVHRFGLTDPAKLQTPEKKQTSSSKPKETFEHTLPLHVAHLAFDIEARKSGELFRRLGVSVVGTRREEKGSGNEDGQEKDDVNITVRFRGPKENVEEVTAWLEGLNERVQIEKCPISTLVSSSWIDVSDLTELDRVARSSKTIITLGEAPQYEVTIYSTKKSSSDKAKTLLTKYQNDLRLMKDRAILSYASPSVSKHAEDSLPIYAMQPFSGTSNTNPFDSNYFRLARQDRDMYSESSILGDLSGIDSALSKPDRVKSLERIDRPEQKSKDVFDDLEERLQNTSDQSVNPSTISFHADFGHLLFKEDVDQNDRQLIPDPPLPGQWVLERAAGWLAGEIQSAQENDTLPAHPPIFHSTVPPGASKIQSAEADQVRKPIFSLDGDVEGQSDEVGNIKQDDSISDIVRRLNTSITGLQQQPKLMDLIKCLTNFEEYLLIRYVSEGEFVEIKVGHKVEEENSVSSFLLDDLSDETEAESKPEWKVVSVERVRSTLADVLVPEAPTDVRLAAKESTSIDSENLLSSNEWQTFLQNIQSDDKETMTVFENVNRFTAPLQIELEGKTFSFLDQKSLNRWEWELKNVQESEQAFKTKAIYTIEKDCLLRTPSKPRFEIEWKKDPDFDANQVSTDTQSVEKVGSEEEEMLSKGKLTWSFAKVYINSVLDTSYSKGYDQ